MNADIRESSKGDSSEDKGAKPGVQVEEERTGESG
jgi:hypothetical protein